MHVTVESPRAGITVLRPAGELDMSTVPAFRHQLQAAVQGAERGLILVLAGVPFMDSAGVAVLIEGLKWSRARTLPYILVELPPAVRMVLELARLESFFTSAGNLEDALALIPTVP